MDAKYLVNFGLDNFPAFIKIVKILASNPSGRVAEQIGTLSIQDQEILVEIAKLSAASQGKTTARYIKNFGITDPEALMDIAKLCARKTAKGLAGFGIESQIDLFDILKIVATHLGGAVIEALAELKLDDEEEVIQVIEKAILKDPSGVAEALFSKGEIISDPDIRAALLLRCCKKDPKIIFTHPELQKRCKELFAVKANSSNKVVTNKIERHLAEKCWAHSVSAKSFLGPLQTLLQPVNRAKFSHLPEGVQERKIKEAEEIKKEGLMLLISLIGFLELTTPIERWPELLHLFPLVAESRRPNLKWRFLVQMLDVVAVHPMPALPSQEHGWITLNKFLGMKLISMGFTKETIDKLLERCIESKTFKDGKNHIALQELLLLLIEEDRIELFIKENLLDKILEGISAIGSAKLTRHEATKLGKEMALLPGRIRQLSAILFFAESALLSVPTRLPISDLLQKLFERAIPLGQVDNFEKKFLATFANARDPMAMIKYVARLNSLHDKEVMESLTLIVTAILEGSWETMRHSLEKSAHLQKMAKSDPDILEKWYRPCASFSLEEYRARHPELLNSKIVMPEGAVVVDTEEWIDILLSGVEVSDSCQNIDGDPENSKGLLGYLMDGKIRMIAIKSKEGSDGVIIARALIKLLFDGEKPLLFLETAYYNKEDPLYESALIEMAQAKAKTLDCPLVWKGKGISYGHPISSLEGPAAFEYSDGAGGAYAHGVYTIDNVRYVSAKS